MQKQSSETIERVNYDFSAVGAIKENYTQNERVIPVLHAHNCTEIGICRGGTGVFFIENKIYPFAAGCVSFIDAEFGHIASSPASSPSEWTFIDISPKIRECSDNDKIAGVYSDKTCENIASIIAEETEYKRDGYEKAVCAALSLLVRLIKRRSAEKEQKGVSRAVGEAVRYISAHYGEEIRVSALARECALSDSAFRKAFIRDTGSTPARYIVRIRLDIAANCLKNTDTSVLQAAMTAGFASLSSFNRFFRREYGAAPGVYARQFRTPRRDRNI